MRYNKRFQVKVSGEGTPYNGDNYNRAREVFRREKERAVDTGEEVILIDNGEIIDEFDPTD